MFPKIYLIAIGEHHPNIRKLKNYAKKLQFFLHKFAKNMQNKEHKKRAKNVLQIYKKMQQICRNVQKLCELYAKKRRKYALKYEKICRN